MSELRFDAVTVRYGHGSRALTAVDGVDLVVPSGAVVGLVGESGSGKSTLARAAAGLTTVTAGRILLDGAPVRRSRAALQMVFQDPYSSLDPRMTVGESIAEALPGGSPLRRGAAARRRSEIERLLALVQLEPAHASAYPAALSGGQRQRVALARALAGDPAVVIADEITSALDVSIQGAVLNLVRDLQRQLRLSMLFISHNLAVVRYVSDIIAVMYLGRVVECGPAADVLADPQHPYTRDLLASVPGRSAGPGRSGGLGRSGGPALAGVARADGGDQELEGEPADPHQPPPGCHYHPRCPVGPLVLADRTDCRALDPSAGAHRRVHAAACHYAATGAVT